MPSFAHISVDDRKAIVDFLLDPNIKKTNRAANANDIHNSAPGVVTAKNASYLYLPPYLNNGYKQFRYSSNRNRKSWWSGSNCGWIVIYSCHI